MDARVSTNVPLQMMRGSLLRFKMMTKMKTMKMITAVKSTLMKKKLRKSSRNCKTLMMSYQAQSQRRPMLLMTMIWRARTLRISRSARDSRDQRWNKLTEGSLRGKR
jgi:hypothetical protein